MLNQKYASICATALVLTLVNSGFVSAESFVLDFDLPATGSNILDMPLESPLGTISASNAGGFSTFMGTGNALLYDENMSADLTMLSFDFEAQVLTFIYTGELFGVFTAIASNELGEVVDEFFNPDTSTQRMWGPITLQGPGIRTLEFGDAPEGAFLAAIDNVEIDTVPEPSSLVGCWLALAFVGTWTSRRGAQVRR